MAGETKLSDMPGHLIRRLNQTSAAVFQDHIRAAGLSVTSVQFATLVTLEQNPGLDQASLAKKIAFDRATIGGVVKRLETRGLVERQPDDEDRRAFKLKLTADGEALLARLKPLVHALQADILQGLTPQETSDLLKLMKKALSAGQ